MATHRFDILKPYIQNLSGILVEVGVHEAYFTKFILETNKNVIVYCVDPYKKFGENEYKDGINDKSQAEYDALYEKVKKELSDMYPGRAHFLRTLSTEAAKFIPDESISMVYVDANHAYKNVVEDFQVWSPKIVKGGLMIGDDAVDVDESKRDSENNVRVEWFPGCYGYYGVRKAALDVFGERAEFKPFHQVVIRF